MDHNIEQAKNMKFLLCVFEQLSGVRTENRNSEIFCIGAAKDYESHYTQLFGCESGYMHFKYLEIPIYNP